MIFFVILGRRRHRKRPLQRQEFHCQRCGKSYSNDKSLDRHRKYECGQIRKYACTICTYKASYNFMLVKHYIRKHQLHVIRWWVMSVVIGDRLNIVIKLPVCAWYDWIKMIWCVEKCSIYMYIFRCSQSRTSSLPHTRSFNVYFWFTHIEAYLLLPH